MPDTPEGKHADIIYPPLDIKTIVDKTAEHVAKSGDAFQQLIRDKYQGNVKFSFIYPSDPYFAYYDMMVSRHKSGKAASAEDAVIDTDSAAQETSPQEKDEVPEQPDPWQFTTTMPAISAQDLDVIKLTAQFVACNGREFMTALAQREQNNYQFDFLAPTHSLFGYFRKLVDQYTLAYRPTEELRARLSGDIADRYRVLERATARMSWEAYEEGERKKRDEEAEKEKEAFLSIDWHDFVVVGTVEFVEEDAYVELPPPIRLQDLKSMSLEEKHRSVAGDILAPTATAAQKPQSEPEVDATASDEEDVEMDVEMDEDVEEIEAEPRPTVPALALGPMKIRKNYVPSLRRGPQAAEVMLQCQLCEREIPASEFEEHIRVELIDPKWKEQKLVYERKIRDTNLVQEGIDIARYLKQMASHRADIFGSESKGEQEGLDGAEGQKIMWDGYSSTAGQATRRARENMTEEERAIAVRRKKGHLDPRDPSLSIGPQLGPPTAKRHKN